MKQKYLPLQDRRNLRILKNTTDKKEILKILESLFSRDHYMIQALWEYREWFYALTDDDLKSSPILTYERAQIAVYEGDIQKAKEFESLLPKDSTFFLVCHMTIPGCSPEDFFKCLNELKKAPHKVLNFVYTLGNPSLLNGLWDITPLTGNFDKYKTEILKTLQIFFPDEANNIFGVLEAEVLYYENKYYEALVKIIGLIPVLTKQKSLHLLFIARNLEAWIMVVNGNAASADLLMEDMKKTFIANGQEDYIPNMNALEAWAGMYTGDIKKVMNWFRCGAPDENTAFCIFDTYRYLIKIRAYIIQGKTNQVNALAEKLDPFLIKSKRIMDRCILHLLWAISNYDDNCKEDALQHMDTVIELSKKNKYGRAIANEATKAYHLLNFYAKERGSAPYIKKLTEAAKETMNIHPDYLKTLVSDKITLTPSEIKVLKQIADYKTNEEISSELNIAVTTVKKHCQNIMKKLAVKNRHEAVSKAYELNLIPQRTVVKDL